MVRRSPPWLVGLCYLPYGLYNGFVVIALPLLLTSRGVPLDRVAEITFVILLPSFWSFLLMPMVDCGMTRQRWALLLAAIAAGCMGAGVFLLDKAHQGSLMQVLLVGFLAAQMYSSTMGGMIPGLVEEKHHGAVSGWLNATALGGAALGGMIAIMTVERWMRPAAAILLMAIVLAPAVLLQIMPGESTTTRKPGEMFRRLFRDMWAVSRTKNCVLGLLIFITPAATFAAVNLFSGLGRDYSASDSLVTWITGAGMAVVCCAGAMAGGYLCDRMDRRVIFVGTGMLAAGATLMMAFGPRVWWVFMGGVLVYGLLEGVNYAAASAVAFEIMGLDNPVAATQYAMLMASCNVAIEFVIWADGRGYHWAGAKGMLCVDAGLSLVTGSALMIVLARYGRKRLSVGVQAGEVATG